MRILLTGACGTLGKALRRIANNEIEFVLLDTSEEVISDGGFCGSFVDEDILMKAVDGCEAIIHTAAMHAAWVGKAKYKDFIATNVGGAATLFDVARKKGIRRVVCSSTMEILVGHDWFSSGTCILDETMAPRPETIYPVSKYQAEMLGEFYSENYGLEVIQLRYMSFSDNPLERWGHRLAAQFVHLDDIADVNLLAVKKPGIRNEVFNIGPDTPFTQRDIHRALKDPWAVLEHYWPGCRNILESHQKTPDDNWFFPVTRIDKAKLILGWKPRYTFEWWLESLGWRRL